MMEQVPAISAADVWHDRLTQFAHRAAGLGGLMLLAGLYGKHGVIPGFSFAFSIYCGTVGGFAALAAWIGVRPEDENVRESFGAFLFCLGLTLGGWVIVQAKGIEVYDPYLKDWLLLRFDFLGRTLADVAAWGLRAGLAMLAIWIGVTSVLTRKGRNL